MISNRPLASACLLLATILGVTSTMGVTSDAGVVFGERLFGVTFFSTTDITSFADTKRSLVVSSVTLESA